MRVVFVTHNELGLACLEELVDCGATVDAIYTRPKREHISDQVPLGPLVDEYDVNLHRVESINTDAVKDQLRSYEPELLFVVGWSRLVDEEVIDVPSEAALGMHPAPLPRGRGRAPTAWTLIKGLEDTKLSFFHLEPEADAGDIVGQQDIDVALTDDAAELYEKTVAASRDLIQRYYPEFEGDVPATSQDDSRATWWPKREPHQGLTDWRQSAKTVYDWIRGQARPYPGAFSYLNDQKVTFWAADPPSEETVFAEPGEILGTTDDAVRVATWENQLSITEIQVKDDDPLPGAALVEEYPFVVGDVFETARDRLR